LRSPTSKRRGGALLLTTGKGRGWEGKWEGRAEEGKERKWKGLKPPKSKFSGYVAAFQAGPGPTITPVFSIISSFLYMFIFHAMIVSLCLPRVLDPSILPSKTVRRRDSFLNA